MLKPIVSVGIATHNGAAFIGEAIESLLAQTAGPVQITVVDDGSTDGTPDLVGRYPQVELIQQSRQGVSKARNRAAQRAHSDVIAFLDQDDIWEPTLAATLPRRLLENPDLGLVYADSTIIDDHGVEHGTRANFLDYKSGNVFAALIRANFIPIETTVLRRELFERLGGFNENLSFLEDLDLCLRIAKHHPVEFVSEVLARYRIHDRNVSHQIEGLLSEYVDLLHGVADSLAENDPLKKLARSQEKRRRYELAWQRIRRGDRVAASLALAGSGGRVFSPTALKVSFGQLMLRCLPKKTAAKICTFLPRRQLYGVANGKESNNF
ncbi:MAG: glycosyltransferase [Planctomycetota bacterium]